MIPVRIGVAGAGRISRLVHLPNLKRISGAVVSAIAELDPRLRAEADCPGARRFESHEELSRDPNVDAVLIALPTPMHASAACAAFANSKHVYLEKPIASTIEEAESIVSAWKSSGMMGAIGFNYRRSPVFLAAREAVRSGVLGKLAGARLSFTILQRQQPSWKTSILLDLGVHLADIARFVFDSDVAESMITPGGFSMQLENGLAVECFISGEASEEHKIEIYGARGKFVRDRLVKNWMGRTPHDPSFANALSDFVACIRSGIPFTPNLDDGIRSLRCLL